MSEHDQGRIIQQLSGRIRQLQQTRRQTARPVATVSTGISAFDKLLPVGGLAAGSLIEWLAPQGGGAGTLATMLATRVLQHTDQCVVIDPQSEFHPPAADGLGLILSHATIIRPASISDSLWAFEQSLRCSGVTVTMAWMEHLTDHVFRRLQLAAEAGGGIGFLLRPPRFRTQRSWADARLLVQPVRTMAESSGWRLQVELLHCRGRIGGGEVELEISDETGDVHLASGLAPATTVSRATGA